ncbi:ATP-binding protein [Streptomyces cinnamoneus]|uniref:ATP-binding protein n=1 Tax=Streptomyces cinnamoneus TaxID=53446 RepID=UPI003423CAA8
MATVSPENRWSYSLTLPHDPRSARVARITLRGMLESHGMDELADITELIVSELVTSSYLNAEGPAEVRLKQVATDRVRVSLWDKSPEIPAPFDRPARLPRRKATTDTAAESGGGGGLLIVRQCAVSWGSWAVGEAFPGVTGKLLWCELNRESGRRALHMAA